MAEKDKPKLRPAIPGNGPYHWGNGPKPYSALKRLMMKLKGK